MQRKKSILKFIGRAILMALPLLLITVALYLYADPFKVTRPYDVYFDNPKDKPLRIGLNKGVVTLANYKRQIKAGYEYNAFIFGSSITCYYEADRWKNFLGSDAKPIHFDSSQEPPQSMAAKVRWLDRNNADLKYALVVLDPIVMTSEINSNPYCVDPPEFSDNPFQIFRYHYSFFRACVNADFLKTTIPALFGIYAPENGHQSPFELQPILYDPIINEESVPEFDSLVVHHPEQYRAIVPLIDSPSEITISAPVINRSKQKAFREIADIFARHNTDYRVVITPNRRKVILNPSDLEFLQQTFGADRVCDYTLTLVDRLETDSLLLDKTHYRNVFSREIMDSIYSPR